MRMTLQKINQEDKMEIEKLPYLALANGLVDAVEEILEVDD